MLIEMHMVQNHSPANLNRDDLGAPKTCYFGGVLRSRISSQCIKRSIRISKEFKPLLGGLRTRRLAQVIAGANGDSEDFKRAMKVLELCGIAPKAKKRKAKAEADIAADDDKSAGIVYVSNKAIDKMKQLFKENKSDKETATQFAHQIAEHVYIPDMALFGRMLEPKGGDNGKGVWKGLNLTVEAAAQVAHAISTHEARPEVDYFVAADDVPGEDAGGAHIGEALYASACFYKYFAIHWEQLLRNLDGNEQLAAHTVGAFLYGAAKTNPSGKQNSHAAHNHPDGILIEIKKKGNPVSYANAFANPVEHGERDLIKQSVAQLSQYVYDMEIGYGKPQQRFWFSPNNRHALQVVENKSEILLEGEKIKSLDELIPAVIRTIGFDWSEVQKEIVNPEVC
ncbi:MAG: type I-E CRISPR-associated protein Cas7/Cse4/CasC [Sedimentisphaerales bacterium]|nr:type I-E CRISPR-associated protein Cas7/Cse4/CasC [Sedimentisphaerales bacterium]